MGINKRSIVNVVPGQESMHLETADIPYINNISSFINISQTTQNLKFKPTLQFTFWPNSQGT